MPCSALGKPGSRERGLWVQAGFEGASVHKRTRGARSGTGHGLKQLMKFVLLCWLGQGECFLSSLLTLPHNLDCT